MKKNRLLILAAGLFIVLSCKDGFIDDITPAEAGADVTAPTVTINYPGNGALVRVREEVTPITIRVEVTDDVEIKSIDLKLDGTQIATFTSFVDFRRAVESYTYQTLGNGAHTLTVVAKDLSGKETSASTNFEKAEPYQPVYAGEVFYMPFENEYVELVNITTAKSEGAPSFAAGKVGSAYAGSANGYITVPTAGYNLGASFSLTFWYKVNVTPERAGLVVIGPPGINTRTNGFRMFREGGKNVFKSNVGNGAADFWNDGGALASSDWSFVAVSVGAGKMSIYFNGDLIRETTYTGTLNWAGCDFIAIGSGGPRFSEWGHASDLSLYDEMRIFNKALTEAEIDDMMND